ncbi:MAG: sensor histidine kinase [Candidatus Thorarchaeota archaeon]
MVLVISNDGAPIPGDARPKVFERGFSTVEGRTGFGLAIAKKLVEGHGWRISLGDAKQTAFHIWISTLDIETKE